MRPKMRKAFRSLLWAFIIVSFFTGRLHAQVSGSYTTTADVPLRSGPGSNHAAITTLPKGIKINVVGKEGHWLKVESKHGGKPGYIDEQFATRNAVARLAPAKSNLSAVAGSYRTVREIELRQGPGAKYPTVARVPANIKVNVVRAEGDWLRVESKKGGKPGYAEKRDLERWRDR
ncbi:MAG TPA: SH3 domain-containing protein [Candidatus Binatus sp.]|nr:SH3 domain-containing protein [Candidatus Binatus sp.]